MKAIIIGALCALSLSAAQAQTYAVQPSGKAADRPTYNYVPPSGEAHVGTKSIGRATTGTACDCSTTVLKGKSRYCAVKDSKPIQMALCSVSSAEPTGGVPAPLPPEPAASAPDQSASAPAPTPTAPPDVAIGGWDANGMPRVDRSKLAQANPAQMYTTERMKSVYNYPGPGPQWRYPCTEGSRPDCTAAPSNIAHQNLNDIGAFREACGAAGMAFDDAIVYPGQPGRSHLHTFFGTLALASTTTENIRSLPFTTCAGGTLNMTSYWTPAVIDTKDGTPQASTSNNVYYKCSYEFPTAAEGCKNIQAVPVGLRLISGSAMNRDPKGAKNVNYICYGPKGENPGWKTTITAAYADGTCVPGGDFVMEVHFPICWDGVNLDSPNHQSHVVNVVQDQQPPFHKHCPADHPVQLPTISYNIHYAIPDAEAVSRWRLASDMYDKSLPAGLSGHGDYMMGWKPETMQTFVQHCLREQRDCHNYLLGDNVNMLY